MNCPSRVDADLENDTHNQNPPALAADLTTNNDLNHIANSRRQRDHKLDDEDRSCEDRLPSERSATTDDINDHRQAAGEEMERKGAAEETKVLVDNVESSELGTTPSSRVQKSSFGSSSSLNFRKSCASSFSKGRAAWRQFRRFMGPGMLISCAYIDPGNYATDVAAGASYRYKLLFVIAMSNFFAIFLQSLCAKLGSVTGKNLPELVKEHFPPWLNYVLWFFNEAAIVATDIAEVR